MENSGPAPASAITPYLPRLTKLEKKLLLWTCRFLYWWHH